MTKLLAAVSCVLALSVGSVQADGANFEETDLKCRANPDLDCITTASLVTTTNTIQEVAYNLSLVLPFQVTEEDLIEMNGWEGVDPSTTVIPEDSLFQVPIRPM